MTTVTEADLDIPDDIAGDKLRSALAPRERPARPGALSTSCLLYTSPSPRDS